MEVIKIGKKNDSIIYANWNSTGTGFDIVRMLKKDWGYTNPDFEILCDAGTYPGTIEDAERFILNEAYGEYMD
jgi:hypothetical protein